MVTLKQSEAPARRDHLARYRGTPCVHYTPAGQDFSGPRLPQSAAGNLRRYVLADLGGDASILGSAREWTLPVRPQDRRRPDTTRSGRLPWSPDVLILLRSPSARSALPAVTPSVALPKSRTLVR